MGNKIDKPNRVIDKETAQNYAESMNVEYFETSAKENKNIDELFVRMTELILKYKNNEEPEEKPVTSMFLHCCLLFMIHSFEQIFILLSLPIPLPLLRMDWRRSIRMIQAS